MKLKYIWPDIYTSLLPRKILELDLQENKATCGECIHAPPRYKKADYYENHLKCCTFQPYLPNYAVGAVLSDGSGRFHKAQSTIRKMIQERRYVLPIGIVPSPRYQILYKKNKPQIFGRDENFLCPYFDREALQCGLWKYRGSVCTSFFCESSYGASGKNFWSRSSDYQSYIEMALMEEALVAQDFSPRQISEQLEYINRDQASSAEMKISVLTKARHREFWQDRSDRAEEFFVSCFRYVQQIDKKEFQESLGKLGKEIEVRLLQSASKLKLGRETKI